MNYVGYYQSLDASGTMYGDDIERLKCIWCFGMEIFECGDFTASNPIILPVPNPPMGEGLKYLREHFKCVYKEGNIPSDSYKK